MRRCLIRKKASKILLLFLVYFLSFPVHIFALPQGGRVVSGQANISLPSQQNMQINQATNKAIINWQDFSIARPESVQFFQPSAAATAMNRVIGVNPSLIYGRLSANGNVFVINPNGILVGASGAINVGSFIASTLDISNEDFLSDNFIFSQKNGI